VLGCCQAGEPIACEPQRSGAAQTLAPRLQESMRRQQQLLLHLLAVVVASSQPVPPHDESDGAALLAAFAVAPSDQPAWEVLRGWKSGSDPCEDNWDGVFCGGSAACTVPGRVCAITLNPSSGGPANGASLRFTLSPAIGQLDTLAVVDLSNTQLHGVLPETVGHLIALQQLGAHSTLVSGTLPKAVGNLMALQKLNVYSALLSGTVPEAVADLPALQTLGVHNTLLSGTLPTVVGKLMVLRELVIHSTSLSGTLPEAVGKLGALQKLLLYSTLLSGTLPEMVGKLTALVDLELHATLLSGTLPKALGNLTKLNALYLYSTPLSGTLPDTVGKLGALGDMQLHSTLLSGTVPDLSGCDNLAFVALHSCALTGLPLALPKMLRFLYLNNNPINAGPREVGMLLYNEVPNLLVADMSFSRARVLLAPDHKYRSFGTLVTKPSGCTVGGVSCAFRLDLVDIYNVPVHIGHAVRGLVLGLGDLRAPMLDLGNGSVLAQINMSWIDRKGAKLFSFYDGAGREFKPIVSESRAFATGANCSLAIGHEGEGGCPDLRTVEFGPRICPTGSHTVADAATGARCVCAAGFPVAYLARNTSDALACHVPCSHGSVPSRDGGSCVCTGSNYDSEKHGILVCVTGEWRSTTAMARTTFGCLPCPKECATCKDGLVTLREGWRLNATTPTQVQQLIDNGRYGREQVVLRCPGENSDSPACPAMVLDSPSTSNLACLDNHAGTLCATCEVGFSLRVGDNSCAACNHNSRIEVVLLIFAMVAVVGAAYHQRKLLRKLKDELLTLVKILLGLLQVHTMLKLVLNIVFPSNIQPVLRVVAVLAIDTRSLFQVDCTLGWYERWLLFVLGIPAVAVGAIGLYWAWQRRMDAVIARRLAISQLFFVIFLLYPQVSQQIFSALRCRRLGESLVVLEVDYGISCDSTEYGHVKIMALILVVLVPLGIPFGLSWLLWSEWRLSRAQWENFDTDGLAIHSQHNPSQASLAQLHRLRTKETYGFCTDEFRPEVCLPAVICRIS
jgi:hypothetical protein